MERMEKRRKPNPATPIAKTYSVRTLSKKTSSKEKSERLFASTVPKAVLLANKWSSELKSFTRPVQSVRLESMTEK